MKLKTRGGGLRNRSVGIKNPFSLKKEGDLINRLTDHLKVMPKDFSTQRALIRLVGKRRSLLDYLQKTEINRYRGIIAELGIRK